MKAAFYDGDRGAHPVALPPDLLIHVAASGQPLGFSRRSEWDLTGRESNGPFVMAAPAALCDGINPLWFSGRVSAATPTPGES